MSFKPNAQALIQTALELHRTGQLTQATELYQQVLALDPRNADALHLLGMATFQQGQLAKAAELIEQAIQLHPTASAYQSNLGNVLQAAGRLDEAAASYRRALALRPNQPETHLNLGHILKALGDTEAALASYRQALALRPGLAEARAGEATALLLQGNYAAGWDAFEARWQTRDYDTPDRDYPVPRWTNEPGTQPQKLLIWGEQGVGDEIQFAGLVPELAAKMPCVLDCAPRLQPLFARSFPNVQVVSGCDAAHAAALGVTAHLPAGSLPGLLRRSRRDFAATRSPYLFADPAQREAFRVRYADGRRLIGLAWHSSNAKSGAMRSIQLTTFAPLLQMQGARWISLQYGDIDALEAQVKAAGGSPGNGPGSGAGDSPLIDRGIDQMANLDLFAAQVAAMDLVITIDNSAAHLAAALGIETWLLLPFAPDWRWLRAGAGSPWYPSVRLFRQTSRGDWTSVIANVQSELQAYVPGPQSDPEP